ncbi:MAG: PEP-CTERM sorting domain-containing protein [Pirellula sp.]
MSRLLFGAFAVVSFLFSGTANAEFYSQLSNPFVKTSVNDPVIGVTTAYISQNDVSLSPPVIGEVFDNFRLTSATSVNKINWVGAYALSNVGLNPTFEINFYQDGVGGLPGSRIGTTLSAVAATETSQSDPGYFLYSADIAPVALLGGTNYWLSIMANVSDAVDGWGWAITGAPVDLSLQGSAQFTAGTYYKYPSTVGGDQFPTVDFAFSLEGTAITAVPEPSSIVLFVTSAIAIFGLRPLRARKLAA